MDVELDHIGKYKILGKIGQGAMGEVFKAEDPVLRRFVAIKTMSAAIGADDELRKRFLREAQSAARLNHPNIITLYDFGEDQGKIYMAMELLEGNDLKDLINAQSLALEDKVGLMEQICEGLAYAHSQQVVHRDLKPANLHVQPNGQLKIMDFGLARLGQSEITRTGMVMGTPNYMSPEQVRGQRADSRSDTFSLGAVFYELFTYHKAFDADSLHAVLFQVLEHEPESIRHWAPEVPEILVHFVERALKKDPAERFQNAAEMRDALRVVHQVLSGEVSEDAGLASMLDVSAEPTIMQPAADLESTRIEPAPTAGSAALKQPAPTVMRKQGPGSGSKVQAPTLSGRATTRVGSQPPTRLGSGVRTGSGARVGLGARMGFGSRPGVSRAGAMAADAEHEALVPAPSQMPLYVGGAAVLVVVAAVGIFAVSRLTGSKTDAGSAQQRALTEILVTSKLDLARNDLEYKNFKGAVTSAQGVLTLDANNADAKEILSKAQGTLKQLEDAAAEARGAMQAGDTEKASQALSRVMAIDPNHPVTAELSSQLNSRFRGQAEEARRNMLRAKADAERVKASSLQSFSEASTRAEDAEDLYKSRQYTTATQRFLDARDRFERARRTAEEKVAVHTPPPPPPATMAQLTPPPATVPITQPPVTFAPPTTTQPTTLAANEEPAVRKVIADFKQAIEGKDLALYKSLRPNISSDDERKLRQAFQSADQRVSFTINSLQIDGNQATVRVTRTSTVKGQPFPPLQQTFVLARGAGGWTIREIQ